MHLLKYLRLLEPRVQFETNPKRIAADLKNTRKAAGAHRRSRSGSNTVNRKRNLWVSVGIGLIFLAVAAAWFMLR